MLDRGVRLEITSGELIPDLLAIPIDFVDTE